MISFKKLKAGDRLLIATKKSPHHSNKDFDIVNKGKHTGFTKCQVCFSVLRKGESAILLAFKNKTGWEVDSETYYEKINMSSAKDHLDFNPNWKSCWWVYESWTDIFLLNDDEEIQCRKISRKVEKMNG
jgi:hypothetical protein